MLSIETPNIIKPFVNGGHSRRTLYFGQKPGQFQKIHLYLNFQKVNFFEMS